MSPASDRSGQGFPSSRCRKAIRRRNAVAADLARGGFSRLVGFITGDLANQFYSALASGIERELREHGLQLLTASSDEDS
ncbi:MAG: hypothetical protein ACLGIS_15215, partial [Actinomycetes bacterium]